MSDDEPDEPTSPYPPDYLDRLPPAPPMRPDLNLIGDLQWPEKPDRKSKRLWFFGRRVKSVQWGREPSGGRGRLA